MYSDNVSVLRETLNYKYFITLQQSYMCYSKYKVHKHDKRVHSVMTTYVPHTLFRIITLYRHFVHAYPMINN